MSAKHCRFGPNGCNGIAECFCDCEECLLADELLNDLAEALDRSPFLVEMPEGVNRG